MTILWWEERQERVKAAATTTQPCAARLNLLWIDAAFSSVTIYREVPAAALRFRMTPLANLE